MDPLATKDRGGCLASLGAEGGDSESGGGGGGAAASEDDAAAAMDTFSSLPDVDVDGDKETLEEKLKGLAFRKQTSYRRGGPAAADDTGGP
ncbi:hypothetical protein CRUP_022009 [Coryphaenoides rupestris]|nr:hypothetical protein CRUP_022009 [Coryphaenoides rupestris]